MHKLKLDLDRLTVESFETKASGVEWRGTVQANSHICAFTAIDNTCLTNCGTCDASCGGTCGCSGGYTCGGTCNGSCYDPTCDTCVTNCAQESCGVYACP
jgi:hypothetical protein